MVTTKVMQYFWFIENAAGDRLLGTAASIQSNTGGRMPRLLSWNIRSLVLSVYYMNVIAQLDLTKSDALDITLTMTNITWAEEDTYNFRVAQLHNSFVTSAGVLVHNGDGKTSSFEITGTFSPEIYEVKDVNTGEVIYMGKSIQGTNTRFEHHLKGSKECGLCVYKGNTPKIFFNQEVYALDIGLLMKLLYGSNIILTITMVKINWAIGTMS